MRALDTAMNTVRSAAARWVARRRSPALLRWAAGRPAALRSTRRGSVLVLVLGALAMLAVVTLIYATVGQETRRTGDVVERRANVQRTVEAVADHIATVVADDVFSTFVQRTIDFNADPYVIQLNREAFDYGFTDPATRSVREFVDPEHASEPTHAFNPVGTFHTPIRRNNAREFRLPSDPWLAATEPTWLDASGIDHVEYRDKARDWAHITNIAPDGRFVNLFNLRGNFDAAPGIESGQMSDRLSAYDASGDLLFAGDFGIGSDREEAATPYLWDSRQYFAFAPANSGRYAMPSNGQPILAEDPHYPPYQWADADGDGLFDSRWFELVDASDPDNIVSLLPKDDRYRWFVAARIIDLSGLINVNTATDFRDFQHKDFFSRNDLKAPFPLGLFPSDVDFRRILTLEDSRVLFGQDEAYGSLQRPVPPNGPDDYVNYDGSALDIADAGYNELRSSLDPFYAVNADPNLPWHANPHYRSLYFRDIASNPTGAGAVINGAGSVNLFTASLFGLADELELRTYRLANDPRTTSRLEFTLDGKFSAEPWGGPLRSNRFLLTERDKVDGGGGGNPAGPADGEIDIDALALSAVDIRQRLTTLSGARPLLSTPLPYDARANAPLNSPNGLSGWLTQLKPGFDNRTSATEALRRAINRVNSDDISPLFFSYADALLPYSGQPDAWNPTTTAGRPWATAHYGSDPSLGRIERMTPELALRTAAHLMANTIDAYDRDLGGLIGVEHHEPRAYTLVTSQAGYDLIPQVLPRAPWWNNVGKLDLGADRLAKASDPAPTADVVNIFGIEPQPFLVEAVTVSLYTDAITGDDEDDENGTGEATINGTTPSSLQTNPDFLGQFFVFQLTNPFNVEIRLTGKALANGDPVSTDEYTEYYVEFGGHLYKLAEVDATGTLKAVTLKPRGQEGSTKVFVAFNQTGDEAAGIYDPVQLVAQRFMDADPTFAADITAATALVRDMLQRQFGILDAMGDPTEPVYIPRMNPLDGSRDYAFASIFGTLEENKAALLWRMLRGPNELDENRRRNDLLADRLGQAEPDAATAHLDRALPQGNEVIDGMPSDETPSIALWASIRRSDNPSTGMPIENYGYIPAYCLEPRWPSGYLANRENQDSVEDTTDLRSTDFDAEDTNANTGGLLAFVTQLANDALVTTIRQLPANKSGAEITSHPQSGLEFHEVLTQIPTSNNNFTIDPDGVPNSGDEFSTIRVADLLLPLGIGPAQEIRPDGVPPPGTNAGPDPAEFMTLSEALAVALGYSSPEAGNPLHREFQLYADWKNTDPASGDNALDRGNLRLDRYTPFYDADGNGIFDPAIDDRLAPGIPLALNILNIFAPYDSSLGSMTRATPGLININTAPLAVLRALPLLNPPTIDWPPQGLQPGPGVYPVTSSSNDIAATLAAYRDKTVRAVLDGSTVVNFSDLNAVPEDPSTWDGRWQTLRAGNLAPAFRPAIREQPGFASIGEVLATTDVLASPVRLPAAHRIDTLANDAGPSGAPGLSPAVYDHDGIDTTLPVPDPIPNDYAEKLLIAAGISNLITVRSDYYAVWFVLHGYQRSDVEGLSASDPLVPSVAKRFVMVLDRSAVKEKGQKPRIVLLEEVPM